MFAHLVGGVAATICGGIPTVLTKHGTQIPGGRTGGVFHRALLRKSHVVAVSAEIREIMSRWAPFLQQRLIAIPNGVAVPTKFSESERFALRTRLRWKDTDQVFISISRVVKGKRLDDLIRAFVIVLKHAPHSKLVIVGDGPELPHLKELAAELSVGRSIEFLGQRMDVSQLLGACDAFVLSSENEGLPMAVLEAMAAGLPIVATRVGEVPFVVQDGTCGFVVPPCSPELLGDAMLRLTQNPVNLRLFGSNARDRVGEHFGVAAAVEKYESVYLHAIARLPSKPARECYVETQRC